MHSLSGVLPLGCFLALHLWTNHRAVEGRGAFDHAVGEIQSLPLLPAIELFGIGLPMAFHALYGLVIAAEARSDLRGFPSLRNWMFVLQRVTGVLALAFLALHVAQFRVAKALGSRPSAEFYPALERLLGEPVMFAVYLVGLSATVVHFANGLWSFTQTWGLAASPRASRRAASAAALVGVLVWALGVNTLLHFFMRCGGVIPWPGQSVERSCAGVD